jgi:DNA-binding transcriptional regulator YiaG
MKREKASHKSSFGKAVIDSLKEFIVAAERGEPITARTVKLDLEERTYNRQEIKNIRGKLGVSQAVFAQLLSISVKTIQAWESGASSAPPLACRLLDEVDSDPMGWMRRRMARQSTTTPATQAGKLVVRG